MFLYCSQRKNMQTIGERFKDMAKFEKGMIIIGSIACAAGIGLPATGARALILAGFMMVLIGYIFLAIGLKALVFGATKEQRDEREKLEYWGTISYGSEDSCPQCGNKMYIDIHSGRMDDVITHCETCQYHYSFSARPAIVQLLGWLTLIPYLYLAFKLVDIENMRNVAGMYRMIAVFIGFVSIFIFLPSWMLRQYVSKPKARQYFKDQSVYYDKRDDNFENDEVFRKQLCQKYSGYYKILKITGIALIFLSIGTIIIMLQRELGELEWRLLAFHPLMFLAAYVFQKYETKWLENEFMISEKHTRTNISFVIMIYCMILFLMLMEVYG